MTLPLFPSPGREPRWCQSCWRRVPKGPLIAGLGSSCARDHGLTPPAAPRPRSDPQEGPSLLDWQTENDDETTAGKPETDQAWHTPTR